MGFRALSCGLGPRTVGYDWASERKVVFSEGGLRMSTERKRERESVCVLPFNINVFLGYSSW